MKLTYIDIKTGKYATESGIHPYQAAENNWSCDCNRELAFPDLDIEEEEMNAWLAGGCQGDEPEHGCRSERFVVVEFEYEPQDEECYRSYTLADFNEEYPEEVRDLAYKMHREKTQP